MDKIEYKKIKIAKFLIGIIVILLIIFMFVMIRGCQLSEKYTKDLSIAIQDTLTKIRNKDGSQTAEIRLLKINSIKDLIEINSKDKTIKWLQQEVKANKDKLKGNNSSVTVISSVTDFTSASTTSVSYSQPVKIGDTVVKYAIYESRNKDTTWIKYYIKANKDTTILDLKVKNDYVLIIGSKRKLFKKDIEEVWITNKNPYTDTRELRTVKIEDKRILKRFNLGFQFGYGITLKGLSPYAGLGINYKIL